MNRKDFDAMNTLTYTLLIILIRAIVVMTTLPVHEFAHGYVAYRLGDPTAKYQGRLTLNPLAHLDLFGTIMLMFTGFGFAKPVPVNSYNFKNRKRDMALVACAGPAANIILAFVMILVYKLIILLEVVITGTVYSMGFIGMFTNILRQIAFVSVGLAVFNLIPVPPLDGSRIALLFLSEKTYFKIMQYERYIFIALFFLLFTGILDLPINFISDLLFDFIDLLTSPVDMLIKLLWR